MEPDRDRQAAIIIRLWSEPDADCVLRARITLVEDLPGGEQGSRVAAGEARILAAVSDWLRRFQNSVTLP